MIGPWIAPVVLFSVVLVITGIFRKLDIKRRRLNKTLQQAPRQAAWEALHPSGPSAGIGSYRGQMEDQQSQVHKALIH